MKFKTLAAAGLIVATTGVAWASAPAPMPFQTHAAFFSTEMKLAAPIDPQVFVADQAAQAATGPQGIKHAAGFRPAMIQSDAASTKVNNADGKPLGFTLGAWLGATGQVTITPRKAGGETVTARFHGLRPHARYSLFENHFDQKPIGFTPLDGKGTANSFRTDAKGNARITVTTPDMLTHANAVLVVYHSDGKAHGDSRGEVGVNAQHQLIARLPAE
jgi:hypothetical protein